MTITVIRNNDCKASVQTIVLMPDLLVYNHIRIRTTIMVMKKGICNLSKKAYCKIFIERSNRSAAPNDCETRKNNEPVL
jgi:type I restriction-modification system DNA methylase subunit